MPVTWLTVLAKFILHNPMHTIKDLLSGCPTLFFPIYRLCAPRTVTDGRLLKNGVEIVIEGFPRSANTFAVLAFIAAQKRDVQIAHHLHIEAQILKGVRLGIPVIVLIRHPVDAISSLLIRHPGNALDYAKRYIKFYSNVLRIREQVVLADFSQVIEDFGVVIGKVNEKFSTDFKIFVHSKENVEAVFHQIDENNLQFEQGRLSHLARPVANRGKIILIGQNDPYIRDAITLYRDLIS